MPSWSSMAEVSAVRVSPTWAVPLMVGRPVASLFCVAGPGMTCVTGTTESVVSSPSQMPPALHASLGTRLSSMGSAPAGVRKNT